MFWHQKLMYYKALKFWKTGTQIYYDFPLEHSIFTISVGYPTAYLLYYNEERNNIAKYENKYTPLF